MTDMAMAAKPKEAPQVDGELNLMGSALADLHNQVEELEKELYPILQKKAEDAGAIETDAPSLVPLACRIREYRMMIKDIEGIVGSMRCRQEISE